MTIAVTTEDYLFGPPSSLQFGGVELGSSDDPAVLSIKETVVGQRPQGAAADVIGLSRVVSSEPTLKVKINEMGIEKLQMILHNITPVVGTATTTTPDGLTTTLSADAAAGASSIVLTAATNIADNKYLKIGDTTPVDESEMVQVNPSWTSGTTIPLVTPLIRAHDAGDPVVMVDDAGTTILQQRMGPISTAQHKNLVMQAVGPDGNVTLVTIFGALADGTLECTLGESDGSGTTVTFKGHASKADPGLAPWAWEKLA